MDKKKPEIFVTLDDIIYKSAMKNKTPRQFRNWLDGFLKEHDRIMKRAWKKRLKRTDH